MVVYMLVYMVEAQSDYHRSSEFEIGARQLGHAWSTSNVIGWLEFFLTHSSAVCEHILYASVVTYQNLIRLPSIREILEKERGREI